MLLKERVFSSVALIIFVIGIAGTGSVFGEIIHVDCDATGANDGSSWEDAYTDLQDALADAASGDQIWVAECVYKPTAGSETSARFSLVDGVEMYGGFAGDETGLEERDYEQNKTYLSGDLGSGIESSRIVLTNGVGAATILDGFEITGGYRGIYSYQSEEIISNCVISQNSGDGIYCNESGPAMDNCIIEDNEQDGINPDNQSSVAITGCIIRNNGQNGIYCYGGSTVIKNNWIHHNGDDGILFYDPAMVPDVGNNTIVYNWGDGVRKSDASGENPDIYNCILWGNVGDELDLCDATYSCIEGGDTSGGNIVTDPNFLHYVSVDYDPNHCDLHLSSISPCMDVGDPSRDYAGEVDIDGEPRVIDIPDIGDGVVDVDMGADEVRYDTNAADLTGEGKVDYRDFVIFAMAWQSEEGLGSWNPACDFVVDGLVDMKDLAFFGAQWGFGWR
jgi:hypothetical protein